MTWLSDRTLGHLREVAMAAEFGDLRYTVIEEIGRGGMGTVYRARDEVLGRDVALKAINADGPPAALARRLQQEARVLARLEHPGIVPVHDAGTLGDGRAFYVMKLVRGASLPDHLAHVPRRDERLRLFERICEPVAFAHANGFVHRDLKPANVMVGSFGEVLVLDWGLAKALDLEDPAPDGSAPAAAVAPGASPVTEAGTIVGTPGYMAPEQQGAAGTVDARADVYALGAVLATVLTGQAPGAAAQAVASSLAQARVPRRLRAICRKAMADQPVDRYHDAAALADDVARFRAGMPVEAHRERAVERAWRVATIYRTPILLVLAYLVMRALVAVYVSYTR